MACFQKEGPPSTSEEQHWRGLSAPTCGISSGFPRNEWIVMSHEGIRKHVHTSIGKGPESDDAVIQIILLTRVPDSQIEHPILHKDEKSWKRVGD